MKRKLLFSALVAIVMTILVPAKVVAQEMYAELDTSDGTLTFKFDKNKPAETEAIKVYSVPNSDPISGNLLPGWVEYDAISIKKVVFDTSFKNARPSSCYYWFNGCMNLTEIEHLDYLETFTVTDMSSMFSGCSSLKSLDLSNFNTSSVTTMSYMFRDCSGLTSLTIGNNFNTSNVENMSSMFSGCSGLTTLNLSGSNFNTSSVKNMSCMFQECSGLTSLNLSSFDTSSVTDMNRMFHSCSGLTSLDLSSFDTQKVTNMTCMFHSCSGLISLNLSNFDTPSVTDMSYMFYGCKELTYLNLLSFDTSSVTNMNRMFHSCSGLTSLNLSSFNTSSVEYMSYMFNNCSGLTSLDLSSFDTQKVTNMSNMFNGCGKLTFLDLSNFNTSSVTNMSSMFYNCSKLTSLDLSNFDTSSVTDMSSMFFGCSGLTSLNLSSFDTSSVTNMNKMFKNCSGLTSLKLSNFDTSSVTKMQEMFSGCSKLTTLDLSNFNTQIVTDMVHIFYKCSGLTSLDLSNFDTQKVMNMSNMFNGCGKLTSLDLSNFDTQNVTNMSLMFKNCTGLITIFASEKFTTGVVTSSSNMFYGCTNLVGAIKYNSNNIDANYANYTTGYFTNAIPMGEGTTDTPYLIKNAKHLAWFRDKVNGGNNTACARLEADIDMSSVCHAADADNGVEELRWTPIGNSTNQWYGTLNGNNKTISNLYINSSDLHQGLFGYVYNSTNRASIKDMIFEDVNIKSSNNNLGVLVGYAYNADISGIVVNSGSVNGNMNVGGIAGLTSNVELSDCINRIDVTGDDNYVGGIVGFAEEASAIKNCANYGNVKGMSAGGIVGQTFGFNGNITLENVFSSGDVTYTDNSNQAGLVVGLTSHGLTISGYVVYNSDAKIYYNNTVQDSKAIGVKSDNANVTGEDNIKGLPHEVLKTGEGTWMLNGLSSTGVWGQQLGTDDYPVPGSDYKVIKAAIGKKDANGDDVYWATFSNHNFDFDLGDLEAYTVKVSEGQMTLTPTADKTVAQGEGVLVKGNSEYLNAKALNVTNASPEGNNDLVATLPTAQTITADDGYILYRLTYKDALAKTNLGFYLAVATVDGTKYTDGKHLNTTPGKAYLKVATSAATSLSSAAPAYSFIFPGDNNTTGIGEIIIEGNNDGNASANANDRIYNLQGQQVTTPTKGLYIRNNKKVIIK